MPFKDKSDNLLIKANEVNSWRVCSSLKVWPFNSISLFSTIIKEIRLPLKIKDKVTNKSNKLTRKEKESYIKQVEKQMRESARNLDFEKASELRDILFELKGE